MTFPSRIKAIITDIMAPEERGLTSFTIEELISLRDFFMHEFSSYEKPELNRVIDKIFKAVDQHGNSKVP